MQVARCGGLWPAARIVELLKENNLKLFASGLTDPELSLAASIHLFAWAGLDLPAALNGPQYLAGRGTEDAAFRAERDRVRLPQGPGLGVAVSEAGIRSLTMATQA
jgi:L-alanine-DL-glutamate epimerase-like enolase superfamily enzyme